MQRTGDLPAAVWDWVGHVVPGVDRTVVPVQGGFSGGIRAHSQGETSAAFLKARPLNDEQVRDEVVEALVLGVLPAEVGAPRMLGAGEIAGWHVTITEFVTGIMPAEPWRPEQLSLVLDHLRRMQQVLVDIPVPARLPSVTDRMRGRADTWMRLKREGHTPRVDVQRLNDWERSHLDRLAAGEERAQHWGRGGHLLHFDLRHDNLLLTTDGRVRVVDWGRASVGESWIDIVCLLLESEVVDQDLDNVFHSALTGELRPDPADLDAFLSVLASYWRDSSHDVSAPPELRIRRRRSLEATEKWLGTRWA